MYRTPWLLVAIQRFVRLQSIYSLKGIGKDYDPDPRIEGTTLS